MNYVDTLFFVFLILVVILAKIFRKHARAREWIIIVASLAFLSTWGHQSLLIFIAVISVNYGAARYIDRGREEYSRYALAAVIVFDLVSLGYFKYYNFFVDIFDQVFRQNLEPSEATLPLAMSFYIFHLVSYLVDLQARRSRLGGLREYIFYLCYFPHLVAGPIVRSWQLFPQIGRNRRIPADLPIGLYQFTSGIFLKSIVADNIAELIDPVWGGTALYDAGGLDHCAVALLYYCQIYADFAGYSLMALGMSRFLGYRLPMNFRQPMFAASLQEFWRRWHITLSRWLRDYLYIPLGGSRGPRWRTAVNLLATMLLGGLWHGAGWTFVIWGAIHGSGLVAERILGTSSTRGVPRLAWFAVTQLWVTLAWIFFRAPDLTHAAEFLRAMADFSGEGAALHAPIQLAALFGLVALLHQAVEIGIVRLPRRRLPVAIGIATALYGVADLVVFAPAKVFIYFKF